MSFVTPKPAAEFSALAIVRSTPWCSISVRRPLRISSRPGRPTMSPMNRMFMPAAASPSRPGSSVPGRGDRSACGRTIVSSPLFEPGVRLRDLECPAQAHRASEATEAALQQMKVRLGRRRGRGLLTGDEEHVAAEEHPHRCRPARRRHQRRFRRRTPSRPRRGRDGTRRSRRVARGQASRPGRRRPGGGRRPARVTQLWEETRTRARRLHDVTGDGLRAYGLRGSGIRPDSGTPSPKPRRPEPRAQSHEPKARRAP